MTRLDTSAPAARAQSGASPRGIGYAVLCASVFSANTVCARIAFEGGLDAPTGNALRFGFTVLVLIVLFARRRRFPALPHRQRLAALALGVPFFFTSFGYLGAIQYLPVSIAVLVLYIFPILVGLISRITEGERLGPTRIAALLLAFLGLGLALDLHTEILPDWRGLGLAFLAASGMSIMVIGSSRVMRGADHSAVNLHLMVGASLIFAILLLIGGGPSWPRTESGWMGLAGLLLTFAAGQLALIAAIGRAGPILTATVMNLEPLITIALAVLFVGERLVPLQLAGAGLVVLAIFLMSRAGRPISVPAAEP